MSKSRVHPDCRNASNPYHECVGFCYLKIIELRQRMMEQPELDVKQGRTTDGPANSDYYPNQADDQPVQESGREVHDNGDEVYGVTTDGRVYGVTTDGRVYGVTTDGKVHPDCRNASNPYHECVEFCFLKIAESKERMEQPELDVKQGGTIDGPPSSDYPDQAEDHRVQESGREEHDNGDDDDDDDDDHLIEENLELGYKQGIERRKKLLEFWLKMDEARNGYQTAMVAEKKRLIASTESRGISKQKWIDETKKNIGKQLDANGLDMKKAYMLDTQEAEEKKYKNWEKIPAPFGWDDVKQGRATDGPDYPNRAEDHRVQESGREDHDNGDNDHLVEENIEVGYTQLTGWRKRLFELKMNEARIADQTAMVAEKKRSEAPTESRGVSDSPASSDYPDQAEDHRVQESGREDHDNGDDDHLVEENFEVGYTQLTGWQKRLFELKMNEARIADQTAIVAEKKRSEAPTESRGVSDSPANSDYPEQAEDHRVQESGREEHDNRDDDDDDYPLEENVEDEARKAMVAEEKRSEAPTKLRGISKQKWIGERTNKIGKVLDANGLDMKKAYMLDTQEVAEKKYKKWEKKPAPIDSDVVNQKTLYDAHNKRIKNIECNVNAHNKRITNIECNVNAHNKRITNIECNVDGEYNKKKEADPESYHGVSSLQYGKVPNISEDTIDKMVKELHDKDENRKEKDINSINDHNEHFNKKFERAFGKYTLTLEIKNNLESGTDLQDYVGAGLFTLCICVGILNCIWHRSQ